MSKDREALASSPRQPTLKAIADAVGVHVSTVSRALRRDPTSGDASKSVRRIHRIGEEMGYRPTMMAGGLRNNRSFTIGGVMPRPTDDVLGQTSEADSDADTSEDHH